MFWFSFNLIDHKKHFRLRSLQSRFSTGPILSIVLYKNAVMGISESSILNYLDHFIIMR